jgi:hypothetical protein
MQTQSSNPSKVVEVKEVIIARRGKKQPERHRLTTSLMKWMVRGREETALSCWFFFFRTLTMKVNVPRLHS